MPEILNITRFGNSILREPARRLAKDEIFSDKVQTLVEDMYFTLREKQYGVGLAAPQVGARIALTVLGFKPTPTRPNLEPFETVLINPEIVETHGDLTPMWEGCVSSGTDENTLYAQVSRYEAITLRWLDENAKEHEERLEGFIAHVAQHEVDHLSGVLFVDRVEDTTTYMLADEYKRRTVG